ncbi:Leucine-zipper-like transcriptional regulator 1 [Phlyctochytrium planicorne]|nr:Leucine-zipper-like transcriptional regulator 1 [Phlyctochytrium planicorne]
MAHLKLTEAERSVTLSVPSFSKIQPGQTVSYGAIPFHVFGRKWGVNIYPHGLRSSSKDYKQRIDIYVHIWARDSSETEEQFLAWCRDNKLSFSVLVTEPEPAALYIKHDSPSLWCDMEDEAGWWMTSISASSRLLDLTNDTLIVEIKFQSAEALTKAISQTASIREPRKGISVSDAKKNHRKKDAESIRHVPFPTNSDPATEFLFNNKDFHDLIVSAESEVLYLHNRFVSRKLPGWSSSTKHARTVHEANPNIATVTINAPYEVVQAFFSFLHIGSFTMKMHANNLAFLYVMSDEYGLNELRRYASREIYRYLNPDLAVTLLCKLGSRSATLQEFLIAFIIQNFCDVMVNDNFKRMLSGPHIKHPRRLLAILRRIETQKVEGEEVAIAPGSDVSPKLDQRHALAFKSLLTSPEVADVHFIVEGRAIYAQKSVLSALSDFFLCMFSRSWAESTSSDGPTIVEIPDFTYSTFYSMLLYLYVNEIETPKSLTEIGMLYVIADKYNILDLVRKAEQLLVHQLSTDNVSDFLFEFAYRYEPLRRLATSYVVREYNTVRLSEGFKRIVLSPNSYPAYSSILGEILNRIVVKDFDRIEFTIEELADDIDVEKEEEDVEGYSTVDGDDGRGKYDEPTGTGFSIEMQSPSEEVNRRARDTEDSDMKSPDETSKSTETLLVSQSSIKVPVEICGTSDCDGKEDIWLDPVDGTDSESFLNNGILFQSVNGQEMAFPLSDT